ncbi:MAG: NAD(P) transhydrogenase subunit alpha [Gammaproteobacteria bacterium]|nr:NAD(P) transhydrogenase subunit alpha [Gammaproteobacteria bacterium]
MTVIAVVKETKPGERRVALSPEVAKKLKSLGAIVRFESGAAQGLGWADGAFEAEAVADRAALLAGADVVLSVQPLEPADIAVLKPGAHALSFQQPYGPTERFAAFRERGVAAFAMELVPRISRAQSMDALSSQAAVAGYRGALIAAQESGKFFPMLTTAAGTIRPAKVLVIGAGVAGLQAIATARRLGAIVQAYDVRSAAREQVESLGAKFIDTGVSADGAGGYARELTEDEKARQQAALADAVAKSDAVITTAAIPGRPSPKIISTAMVEAMAGGSVIVDLAAEGGGNCELAKPGETVKHRGVTILAPLNVASTLPVHASEMYAKNLLNFLQLLIKDGALALDLEDPILKDSLLSLDGRIVNAALAQRMEA